MSIEVRLQNACFHISCLLPKAALFTGFFASFVLTAGVYLCAPMSKSKANCPQKFFQAGHWLRTQNLRDNYNLQSSVAYSLLRDSAIEIAFRSTARTFGEHG